MSRNPVPVSSDELAVINRLFARCPSVIADRASALRITVDELGGMLTTGALTTNAFLDAINARHCELMERDSPPETKARRREIASQGAYARAESMSGKRRQEIARKAAQARWGKKEK